MNQPCHGYFIAKVIGDVIGPFAKASMGRIYPLLTQMEKDELVTCTEEEHDGRTQRVYHITHRGRIRFHRLMMDTTSNPKGYQEMFSYKVTAMEWLEPEERLYLVDHYITYCQAHIVYLNSELNAFRRDQVDYWTPAQGAAFESLMQQRIKVWELEASWAREFRPRAAEIPVRRP